MLKNVLIWSSVAAWLVLLVIRCSAQSKNTLTEEDTCET